MKKIRCAVVEDSSKWGGVERSGIVTV